jgi:hypothetical protein
MKAWALGTILIQPLPPPNERMDDPPEQLGGSYKGKRCKSLHKVFEHFSNANAKHAFTSI